jgi:hypothetical protein
MVFNATYNNISAISWRSVLLVEETGVPRENLKSTSSWIRRFVDNITSVVPCVYGFEEISFLLSTFHCSLDS